MSFAKPPPYTVVKLTLAANSDRSVSARTLGLTLLSATADGNVEVRFSAEGDYTPLIMGLTIADIDVPMFWVRNTSGSANTISLIVGSARIIDNRTLKNSTALDVDGAVSDGGSGTGVQPVVSGGKDGGGLVRSTLMDTVGRTVVVGPVAAGSAISTSAPLLCGGSDGTNVQRMLVDTGGRTIVAGAVAAGSAIGTTAPVLAGLSDGTNVQRQRGSSTGAAMVTGEAAHSAAAVGNPVRVGGRVATAADTTLVAGDAADVQVDSSGAQVTRPYGLPEVSWQYAAAAAGIVNTTTAVTIKASAGAGLRNYLTGLDIFHEALTTATELVIRDGASGTVIYRTKLPSGQVGRFDITFPVPLRGTAATLLEVATLTASGAGAVYFNAQGTVAP